MTTVMNLITLILIKKGTAMNKDKDEDDDGDNEVEEVNYEHLQEDEARHKKRSNQMLRTPNHCDRDFLPLFVWVFNLVIIRIHGCMEICS